jgi:predicted glycogen debranching enzyme
MKPKRSAAPMPGAADPLATDEGTLIAVSDVSDAEREWLETDGLGGFASGTALGLRTRRYHSLLTAARGTPSDRFVLVNGIEAWWSLGGTQVVLTSQAYLPEIVTASGLLQTEVFGWDPWPNWRMRMPDARQVVHELFMHRALPCVCLSFRFEDPRPGSMLHVRPLLSGRSLHGLQRENASVDLGADLSQGRVIYRTYPHVPAVAVWSNGQYRHEPCWYRNFRYDAERARGLDFVEDHVSPGIFSFNLAFDQGEAVVFFALEGDAAATAFSGRGPRDRFHGYRAEELARRGALGTERQAAQAYVVARGKGETIVAGYPWFTDWGRDTFIALRGLCLSLGQWDRAKHVLLTWSRLLSGGMLPNRFPDGSGPPEYTSVDSAFWFAVAVQELCAALPPQDEGFNGSEREHLLAAVDAIVRGTRAGTRHGIAIAEDGLLTSGEQGLALTWMDARVDGVPVTPRAGKPVELQALWLNTLHWASERHPDLASLFDRGMQSFSERFWFQAGGYLHDVVDVDGKTGAVDESLRPNQIFAVGGLPLPLLSGERARSVVDTIERELWTPVGLRTLAPGDPRYQGRYLGGPEERDRAYHQGTAWPWLLTAFVEGWLRVHGNSARARGHARKRFLAPLRAELGAAGLGHVPEIADGDPPHTPRGCPFQAWSMGEYLRLEALLKEGEELEER